MSSAARCMPLRKEGNIVEHEDVCKRDLGSDASRHHILRVVPIIKGSTVHAPAKRGDGGQHNTAQWMQVRRHTIGPPGAMPAGDTSWGWCHLSSASRCMPLRKEAKVCV